MSDNDLEIKAYGEGAKAYMSGDPITNNQYDPESIEGAAWAKGFSSEKHFIDQIFGVVANV